ncbi:MAG: type I-C CRISPR-associated protein Cas7/Csd2 [Hydrococcus sp. SU_1_0]|nr:type I-C CRISPR-associated protein Cas7/Csd2 [Hydrococcus sp. SU_1_0]
MSNNTDLKPYLDPSKRHDFVLLFDVTNGNPNGDPDADNLPRIDPETMLGLVTDVALKRKVRDYVAGQLEQPIFIQSKVALNTLILQAFRDSGVEPPTTEIEGEEIIEWFEENSPEDFSLDFIQNTSDSDMDTTQNKGTLTYTGSSTNQKGIAAELSENIENSKENENIRKELNKIAKKLAEAAKPKKGKQKLGDNTRNEAQKLLCQKYYDIRMFGAVLATGLNAGQVRGPLQFTFARSIDPILRLDLSITRQARTTTERFKKEGTSEFGRKAIIPYGLYRAHGFFNPLLGKQTEVSQQDLEYLWQALWNMFEFDRSASRAEMIMQEGFIFTHENPKGNAHSHKLFEKIKIDPVGTPRSFTNYKVDVADESSLPQGITLKRLSEIFV